MPAWVTEQDSILEKNKKTNQTKTKQTKKLQVNITDKHSGKNPQLNTIKLNPTAYQKDKIPQPTGIYLRDTRMVQHMQINKHNTSHQQNEDKKHMIISTDVQ